MNQKISRKNILNPKLFRYLNTALRFMDTRLAFKKKRNPIWKFLQYISPRAKIPNISSSAFFSTFAGFYYKKTSIQTITEKKTILELVCAMTRNLGIPLSGPLPFLNNQVHWWFRVSMTSTLPLVYKPLVSFDLHILLPSWWLPKHNSELFGNTSEARHCLLDNCPRKDSAK